MGRQWKNENAEAYEYLFWRKNRLAQTYAGAASFSMDVNVSTKPEKLGHSCWFPNSLDKRERS
jgi:hypothetical protein